MKVLVAGAGPAGAIAALVLARHGIVVDLCDKSAWPREKTCGDGISPLALAELHDLGIEIPSRVKLRRALVTTPNGRAFRGAWPPETPWGTILPRREFDALLVDAAIASGARFMPQTPVDRARIGAYDAAVIADGATGGLARELGFTPHRSRLIALRGYVDTPAALDEEYGLFYDRDVAPGYGWIFPVSERRANAGICVDERVLASAGGNPRVLLARWLANSPFTRERLGDRPHFEDLKGGIIPTGRKKRSTARIVLAGDAAGVADPFTAEGIFQAIRSGRLAAQALISSNMRSYERSNKEFDRNAAAATGLRNTFRAAIELCALRAEKNSRFGDYLSTAVFFPKRSLADFGIKVLFAALQRN